MENKKKPFVYYWLMVLLFMGIINMVLLPMFTKDAVKKVTYDVFLNELKGENVSEVQVNEDDIYFVLKGVTEGETEVTPEKVFITGRMDDSMLAPLGYSGSQV